jgi:PST family polysaccharide transporter
MVNKIIDRFRRIIKLDIVKVFSFTSVSTLVKMIAGFISVKVVAVIIGPSGVALVGQLNNFSAIIMAIATGGITSGITKYIAQYKDDSEVIKGYIGTAVKATLFFSIICGLFLVFGSAKLSEKILLDVKYSFVFIVFGITLVFYACNTLLLAIINGYKQFNLYVKISIASSFVGLILSLLLVIPFGVNGALINAVTSQSLVFIIAFILAKKTNMVCLSKDYIWNKFDKNKAIRYFRFALMTLVSAFTVPVSQLIIRGYLISHFSLQEAGWWEGINRLSGMYLMIITSSFGVYYLPKLSELTNGSDIKREIKNAYKVIIPCLLAGLSCVYFGRFLIIKVLFSEEFYEMAGLFFWQLIGDFLKISSWLIAYLMHAKAMAKYYIITEVVFSLLYIIMAFFLVDIFGLIGVVMGYAVNYLIYFVVMYIFVYRKKTNINSEAYNEDQL